MVDFNAMKNNRTSAAAKLTQELKNATGSFSNKDDRFWYPEKDKVGNASAIIRFLPAGNDEEVPFVRIFSHSFKGPGGWYIEKSLTTIGQQDYIAEENNKLWNTEIKENQEIVRKRKRKLLYTSNIYVISDPANPENEGKTFLFSYGKKVFDKLNDLMHPEFNDEEPVNPFCLWEGANFRLRIREVEGYSNYDKSEFDTPGPLFKTDEELAEKITNLYSLQDLISPDKFKSYDELKKQYLRIVGNVSGNKNADSDDLPEERTYTKREKTFEPKQEKQKAAAWEDSDDEDLAFFSKLKDDD